MMNRREFVQAGMAAAVVGGVGVVPLSATRLRRKGTRQPVRLAVFDERYGDSRAFGHEAAQLGVPTHAMRGDITALWFNDLDLRWRHEPMAVAGLTTEASLFCLEDLARDHRMRVVFRADHVFDIAGVVHTVVGPVSMVTGADGVLGRDGGQDWPLHLTRLMHDAVMDESPVSTVTVSTPRGQVGGDEPSAPRDFQGWWGNEPKQLELLVSWIIAPGA